jgi:hypothetical protein
MKKGENDFVAKSAILENGHHLVFFLFFSIASLVLNMYIMYTKFQENTLGIKKVIGINVIKIGHSCLKKVPFALFRFLIENRPFLTHKKPHNSLTTPSILKIFSVLRCRKTPKSSVISFMCLQES